MFIKKNNNFVLYVSLFICLILQIITSCYFHLYIYKPEWLFLILIYCAINFYKNTDIICISFLSGIILDIINGCILGTQSFSFMIIIYIIKKIKLKINFFLLQELLLVIILLIIINSICFIIKNIFYNENFNINIIYNSICNSFLWPILKIFMKKYTTYNIIQKI